MVTIVRERRFLHVDLIKLEEVQQSLICTVKNLCMTTENGHGSHLIAGMRMRYRGPKRK